MPPEAPEKTRRQKITSWLFERLGRSVMTAYGTTRTLYRGRSRFQSIELAENPELGKLLLLDNELQSASSDEFIYHETLVHPAMLAHPNPRQVVILGGGEGGTLREVLKHPSVERAIMIDIDREVVEACRRFLPEQSDGAFEDPRAELVFDDSPARRRSRTPSSSRFSLGSVRWEKSCGKRNFISAACMNSAVSSGRSS